MGNIQVKVCKEPSLDNGFNCADKSNYIAGYCKGKSEKKFKSKSPSEWNGDKGFICASGYEAHACGIGGCACKQQKNCGKLAILPMIIFLLIAIVVIYISIMARASARGDL